MGHSWSGRWFGELFEREGLSDCRYELFPLPDIAELPGLLAGHPELCGLNVTIPHKEQVMAFLNEEDPVARVVGAVNCIRIRNGHLRGFNTDVTGFEKALFEWLSQLGAALPARALVLGTGGAAKAVAYVLGNAGVRVQFVSRHPGPGQLTYTDLDSGLMTSHRLVVNATPLGTFPNTETLPAIPFGKMDAGHFCFDVVYNPSETAFMKAARQRGAAVTNGLRMLHLQAKAAWRIMGRD